LRPIFSAHGRCDITVENNIIFTEAEGPWNIEFFQHLHLDLIEAAKKVDYNNFTLLLKVKGVGLAVEEAIPFHIDFILNGNVKAVAINLDDCGTPSSCQEFCSKVYNTANVKHKYFNDNEPAIAWLNEQMAMSA